MESLLAAHDALEQRVKRSTFIYQPDVHLTSHRSDLKRNITAALQQHEFSDAIIPVRELGSLAEQSLLYLQRYHWKLLYGVVLVCYIAWMLALLTHLAEPADHPAEASQGLQQRPVQAVLAVGVAAAAIMSQLTIPVRPSLLPS